jgi:signal transduction histidine kinase
MEQVLLNLLGNAVKYFPGGGVIRIKGRASGRVYRFSIEDQGVGMKPEQVERIFDRFYRADSSSKAPRGIGLGMSIVKNLIEAHEGKIWVESEFGKGTKVSITLPIREEEKS